MIFASSHGASKELARGNTFLSFIDIMTTRKVYSSGGSNSGYHLGSANQKITKNARPDEAVPHNGKPYVDIKKHCVKEGVLFEDPDFPAVDSTLFFSKKPPKPFVWKRPKVCLCKFCI